MFSSGIWPRGGNRDESVDGDAQELKDPSDFGGRGKEDTPERMAGELDVKELGLAYDVEDRLCGGAFGLSTLDLQGVALG